MGTKIPGDRWDTKKNAGAVPGWLFLVPSQTEVDVGRTHRDHDDIKQTAIPLATGKNVVASWRGGIQRLTCITVQRWRSR